MRPVLVHPTKSIRFTMDARYICEMINLYKKNNPTHSFKQIAEHFNLSESNTRRYYYGIHHTNLGYFGRGYTQMRRGACVDLGVC
tara:strand:- start:85 stop:339 length:255 start_codon:yes stop_codon:yes gene_type:complete